MTETLNRIEEALENNWAVEAEDIRALVEAFKSIEHQCWDLRCESVPIADTGDYDIQWVIYEHYQGQESKPIGYGKNPLEAILDAEEFIHGKPKYY